MPPVNKIDWSSGLVDVAVGWTAYSNARVDSKGEDVATLGGTVEEGGWQEEAWTRVGEVEMDV